MRSCKIPAIFVSNFRKEATLKSAHRTASDARYIVASSILIAGTGLFAGFGTEHRPVDAAAGSRLMNPGTRHTTLSESCADSGNPIHVRSSNRVIMYPKLAYISDSVETNLLARAKAGCAPATQSAPKCTDAKAHTQLNYVLTYGRGKVVAFPMETTFSVLPPDASVACTTYNEDARRRDSVVVNSNGAIDVVFNNTPLSAAISQIQKELKYLTFVLESGQLRNEKVTLSAHGRQIYEVLNLIAASAKVDIWIEDAIYHIAKKGTRLDSMPLIAPPPTKLGRIKLNFAKAETVRDALTGEGGTKIEVTLPAAVVDNSMFSDIGGQIAPGPLSPGTTAHHLLPPGYKNGLDEQQNENRQGGFVVLAPIEPKYITVLSSTNTIMVRYHDDAEGEVAFRMLQVEARLLDVKPRKIQIRAQFVSVTQSDTDKFGIDWQFQRVLVSGDASRCFPTFDRALMEFASGDMQAQLNFILTTGTGKLVASPVATTYNVTPVTFNTKASIYSFVANQTTGANGASQTTYDPVPVEEVSRLEVIPRINSDNEITLNTRVQLQDVHADSSGEPMLAQQDMPLTRIVRNGETLVIARLLRKHDSPASDKMPLKGDLPLMGSLFRSTTINADDTELLVFITATILADPISNTPTEFDNVLSPGPGS